MPSNDFYSHYSGLADEQLRSSFTSTLERPGSIDGAFSQAWHSWLVSFLLKHFVQNPPATLTDQCRYVAFALRYLAAIQNSLAGPMKVGQVLWIMENRLEITAALLFGSVEDRKKVLQIVVDPAAKWETLELEPYQEAVLARFHQRFSERKTDKGFSTFDESTVAKWSRDLIPELESLILEYFHPARQVAQRGVLRQIILRDEQESPHGERGLLAAYIEQFETGRLHLYYGLALQALNDFDRRVQNQHSYVSALRGGLGVSGLMIAAGIGVTALQVITAGGGLAIVFSILFVLILLIGLPIIFLTMSMLWALAIAGSEHVTKTRTDIQTLQQLADCELKQG